MSTTPDKQPTGTAATVKGSDNEPKPGPPNPVESLIALSQELATTQQQKYQSLARLAASDLHLALGSLLKILVLAAVTAGLMLAAWVTAMATAWQAIVAAGMDPVLAGLLVTGLNLVACILAVALILRFSRLLTFPYFRAAIAREAEPSS